MLGRRHEVEILLKAGHCKIEESFPGVDPRKEGFLTPQTPFGMTGWCFFRSLSSQTQRHHFR